ncbi:alkylglycerol monooxygenase [Brienomyrus brachyistius]|uniref:alkylglycerol monooxygenase n=1 Tax=Brienomyrus brachyistius TaxID=42636 RepID=UPI0020B33386|nr:alkylglycerol monooxygenase [Brienomyrus brachyistius]
MASPAAAAFSASQDFRAMFYLLTPNETSFEHEEEVPEYVSKATPCFLLLIILEQVLGWAKTGKLVIRVNDGITSLSAGVMSRLSKLFAKGLEISCYIYVWENYRLLELPWDSPWTWWLAFLGVDFGYYWLHRLSHEMNILWAAHQVHHSSEDYNLSTALRQSATQQLGSWIFYLPMALAVPPSVFAVHVQFNLLYQFWIHTELVTTLGPLEWVLNTPSHHRVHHGRNRYCIDKNYGGTLIIWDRLFDTFTPETDKIIYGLTHPINTFEIMSIQFFYYPYLWGRFWSSPGVTDKLSVVLKGPGWEPGKPRLGCLSDLPEITGKELPHNPSCALVLQAYVTLQFGLLLGVYDNVFAMKEMLSPTFLLLMTGYILLSLTTLGFIIEQRHEAAILETFRCLIFLVFYKTDCVKHFTPMLSVTTEVFITLSMLYWGLRSLRTLADGKKKQP